MLSPHGIPMLMPKSSTIFQPTSFSLSMYQPTILFHPTPLYPGAISGPPRGLVQPPWKRPIDMSTSAGPSTIFRENSSSTTSTTPSPPGSPGSASGEKTAFTIDAILSSNKHSPVRECPGAARSGPGGTPSPDFSGKTAFDSFERWERAGEPTSVLSPVIEVPSPVHAMKTHHSKPTVSGVSMYFPNSANMIRKQERVVAENCSSPGRESSAIPMSATERSMDGNHSEKGVKRSHIEDGWSENPKAKRVRTIFTQDQLERLEKEFDRQQYMVGTERLYLAAELNLSESQVKVWFQNRRIKWRKQNFEKQQAQLVHFRAIQEKRKDRGGDGQEYDHGAADHEQGQQEKLAADYTHEIPVQPSLDQAQLADDRLNNGWSMEDAREAAVSKSLELEVEGVEQRLALRLCRRNMMSTPSSTSSPSTHSELISSIRRMRDVGTTKYLFKSPKRNENSV